MAETIYLNQPVKAVILCGGRGSRLRPITDTLPKPMAPVNGKPFLEYLLWQLASQGVRDFLLLTGYLANHIEDYFCDGSQWGWTINYSRGPAEWDTGRRVYEAQRLLPERFLLMYSDNFVQFNLRRLQALHEDRRTPISLLLSPKSGGNIRVTGGSIDAYDSSRTKKGLDYVEVGYMLVERDEILGGLQALDGFPDLSFSSLLQSYAASGKLSGLIVKDTYHSISDLNRLELTSRYLAPKKIILIDRDGTVNKKAPQGEYISAWEDFEWLPDTRAAMVELSKVGFEFIVITNQAGISRGLVKEEAVTDINTRMVNVLAEQGVIVRSVYVSPHHWDENSFDRKPAPGMFFRAAREHLIRLDRCLYVGDDERDCIAAANAGCGMVFVTGEGCTPTLPEVPVPFIQTNSLGKVVDEIVSQYEKWATQG
jgi:histidinol-phosphate phosphatase family protein